AGIAGRPASGGRAHYGPSPRSRPWSRLASSEKSSTYGGSPTPRWVCQTSSWGVMCRKARIGLLMGLPRRGGVRRRLVEPSAPRYLLDHMYQEADGLRREGTVRALFGARSYRLYWYSSAMFGLGIWAFLTALGWTALQLTDSAFGVSVVNVAYFTPVFLFAIPSGVLADTVSRRLLVVGS